MWKSRFVYALSLAGAVFFIRYDQRLGFTALYALLLLLGMSLLAVLLAPTMLALEEDTGATELYKGDTLHYRAVLRNRGPFFYPCVQAEYYSAELINYGGDLFSLSPRSAAGNTCDLPLPWRGAMPLGIRRIYVSDFLGLFTVSFPVTGPRQLIIFPRADESFEVYIRNDSQYATWRTEIANESPTDVADIRKYAPADSLRRVHWKLSAKRGELMVKNYHSFDPNETYIFLDTRRVPPAGALQSAAFEDKIISFATAAAEHCAEGRIPSMLLFGSDPQDGVAIDPEADIDNLYRLLAGIRFEQDSSPFPAFSRAFGHAAGAFNLLLLISHIDSEIFDALRQLQSWDHMLSVYYFFSPDTPPDEEQSYYLDSLQAFGLQVNRVQADLSAPESEAAL